ncbi:MAG: AAA family ATPase [Actinomycetota bacterium]|nr:AAA family ATPase [Actinomycetota bacterium]MDP9020288.1 AAA family ATPase [Actinomycetota bacterium]
MRNPRILVLDRSVELEDQIADVTDDLRPRPEVATHDRLEDVDDVLARAGAVDVLVAGPGMGDQPGLARLRLLHDELPTVPVVLAFDHRPKAPLRDMVQAGAIDLVKLPVHDKKLLECLERALELARRWEPPVPVPAAATLPAPGPVGAPVRAAGRVFTVASATGGCGKTFMATNLAYFLARHSGQRVCVIDLDLQFGEVSTALRLKPRFTIYDALQRDDSEDGDLYEHIEEYLVAHETGVHVLAAPRDPSEADRINPPDVTRIIEAARAHFDYVVVDTPSALTEIVLAAFEGSERLFVMATLDLPSVRNLGVFLTTLEKLRVPTDDVRLILNKAESDVGIEISQVEKLFPQGFQAVLPYAKEVSRSINVGMPVLASSPNAEVSRSMVPAMSAVLPEGHLARIVPPAPASGPGRLSRLFHRPEPRAS